MAPDAATAGTPMPGNVESPQTSSPARRATHCLKPLLAARGLVQKQAAYTAGKREEVRRQSRHTQGELCLRRSVLYLGQASLARGMCPGLPGWQGRMCLGAASGSACE